MHISTAPSQFATAERQLATANTAVRTAVRELDELEARQQAASTELAALTAARATEARAVADLADADAHLTAAEQLLDGQRRQVADRAVEASKYGSRGASS